MTTIIASIRSIPVTRRVLSGFLMALAVTVATVGLKPAPANAADSVGSVYTDPSLTVNYGYCTLFDSYPNFDRSLTVKSPVVQVNREQWVAWWVQIYDMNTGGIYKDWSFIATSDVKADGTAHQLIAANSYSTTSQTTAVSGTGALEAKIAVGFWDPQFTTFNGWVLYSIQRYAWQDRTGASLGAIRPACGGF
jgi:hypothetical protein